MRRKTSHYFLDASPFHFCFACIHSFSFRTGCTGFLCFLKVKVSCKFISYFVFFFSNSGKFTMPMSKTYKNRLDLIVVFCFD